MTTENTAPNHAAQEVEIAYTSEALLDKLAAYSLLPQTVLNKIRLNQTKLNKIAIPSQTDSYLSQLYDTIKQLQPSQNIHAFTAQINQFTFLWLNAIQDGTPTKTILSLLKCIEIKSVFNLSSTANLHCFLFDLLAETMRQHQELSLDYIVNFDTNTQLPNSNLIINRLNSAINNTKDNQLIGLLSLNFQSAKYSFSFSKQIAKDLNKRASAILQENLNTDYELYFNADSQFDILISNLSDIKQVDLIAAKITRAFEEMLFLNEQSILITPYIGCAYGQANKTNAGDLYHNSKLALESAIAKQVLLVFYDNALEEQILEQNNLESKVLEAFASDNLTLYFQPIINLKDMKCAGAELLLRWSDKFGYTVSPGITVEILNKVGKGKLFTRWLINSACRFASELKNEHELDIHLTLNLRAEDLYYTELPDLLSQAVILWKINAQNIVLEITENGILEYNEATSSVINRLSTLGFKFALDDFGTGFSSLSRLRTMPIDLIKVDQSFIRHITQSKEDYEIVQSIAMLAKSLGKEVVAEGVEDAPCLNLIKNLGIDKCQGYHFAKPLPFDEFVGWAKRINASLSTPNV